jgi:hypothetical protein
MKTEFEKKNSFKFYHKTIPILTIPFFLVCIFLCVFLFFSTISNRSGLWGNLYLYYDLTKFQYCTYLTISILILICSVLFQIKYLLEKDVKKLNKTFKIIGSLMILLIFFAVYLEARFIGKG